MLYDKRQNGLKIFNFNLCQNKTIDFFNYKPLEHLKIFLKQLWIIYNQKLKGLLKYFDESYIDRKGAELNHELSYINLSILLDQLGKLEESR